MDIFLSAFVIGFLGSFHCAGMCGPIALALPQSKSKNKNIHGRLLYNFGRLFTYSTLGLIFGSIGYSISIKGFQSDLSILTGVLILIALVVTAGSRFSGSFSNMLTSFTTPIKNQFKKLFGKGSLSSLFFIGLLNGILPCGFVYLALAAATATGNYFDGMFYMFLFGLGTLPMMFFISIIRNIFNLKFQLWFNKATPIIAIAVALLLIYRGAMMKETGSCCEKNRVVTARNL